MITRKNHFLVERLYYLLYQNKLDENQLREACTLIDAIKALESLQATILKQELAIYSDFQKQFPRTEIELQVISLNAKDSEDWSPLGVAVSKGRATIAAKLLAAGANVNQQNGRWGRTALMEAAKEEFDECVDLLLKAKANVHLTDPEGYSALKIARIMGNEKIIWQLESAEKASKDNPPAPQAEASKEEKVSSFGLKR